MAGVLALAVAGISVMGGEWSPAADPSREAPGTPVQDALAVLAVTHPHLFDFEATSSTLALARTVDAGAALRVIGDAVAAGHRSCAGGPP